MGKTKQEIQKRHNEILVELDKIEELATRENRAFTKEEEQKYDALMREDNRLHIEIQGMLDAKQMDQFREMKSKNEKLRELLKECKENRESFSEELQVRDTTPNVPTTVLKDGVTSGTYQNEKANLEASGAVPLTIHELIDTKVAGLELGVGTRLAGEGEGTVAVLVQGDHHEVGIVDPFPLTGSAFHIGIHADFHGSRTDPGYLASDDHHIILISTVQESQIVHRRSGHIAHGMALGYNAGHLIDPLHQNATEKTVGTV